MKKYEINGEHLSAIKRALLAFTAMHDGRMQYGPAATPDAKYDADAKDHCDQMSRAIHAIRNPDAPMQKMSMTSAGRDTRTPEEKERDEREAGVFMGASDVATPAGGAL
ncbi:MAG: hypothetical protein ABSB33_05210 [Tepidisphaeraceae bacterium]|jgi:hypothetical protein